MGTKRKLSQVERVMRRYAASRGVKRYGAQSMMANDLGITRAAISLWMRKGRVPGTQHIRIAEMIGCHPCLIRPDLYGVGGNGL